MERASGATGAAATGAVVVEVEGSDEDDMVLLLLDRQ